METNCHVELKRITASKTIVLCVHGIQGTPLQFKWIVSSLPEDIDYLCILLPGHGEGVEHFRKVGEAEWRDYLFKVFKQLKSKYDRIIYVGHSMGCLLGITLASIDKNAFAAMLLLACPLVLKPTVKYFINNIRAVVGNELCDPYVNAIYNANSVRIRSPFQIFICIKPYWNLFKLIAKARRQIVNLEMPIILIFSDNDEIVSKNSLMRFDSCIHAKYIIVPQSGHFLYSVTARKMILSELQSIIDTV